MLTAGRSPPNNVPLSWPRWQKAPVGCGVPSADPRTALPCPRQRRPLSEILIEVGLYVGAALVIAAAFVLVAQNWESMSLGMQIAVLAITAVAAAGSGLAVGHGAVPGPPAADWPASCS